MDGWVRALGSWPGPEWPAPVLRCLTSCADCVPALRNLRPHAHTPRRRREEGLMDTTALILNIALFLAVMFGCVWVMLKLSKGPES